MNPSSASDSSIRPKSIKKRSALPSHPESSRNGAAAIRKRDNSVGIFNGMVSPAILSSLLLL